ncbi:MAG: nucleotide exchange factor GrpE [Verrucomicrobiales bacterium]|nr:nucleotide exchange factor GrpE [Verrucomicrobiales bacterium]
MNDTPPPNPEPTIDPSDIEPPVVESANPPEDSAEAEIAKWKDLAYRSQAELDNYRKRMTRETQDIRAYANADLLRSLLPILDNFEMGLDAARAESEKSMVFMGMQMVHRQIQDFLKDFGVTEVEAAGQSFDPNLHDAVAQQPSSDQAEGTILEVKRRGYRLKDRLLRPSTVVVASAPQETHAEEA